MTALVVVLGGISGGMVGVVLVLIGCLGQAQETLEAQGELIEELRRQNGGDARRQFAAVQRLRRVSRDLDEQVAALESGLRLRGGGQAK